MAASASFHGEVDASLFTPDQEGGKSMSDGIIVKRVIWFTHRSFQSPVDIVPLGFRLFGPSACVEEMFFGRQPIEGDLALLCLTDTVFLEDESEVMPMGNVRPFLRAHYDSIKSRPLRWSFSGDLYEDENRVQFELSVWQDAPKLMDRLELLEVCLREVSDGALPCWFMALKDDVEFHVPARYCFEIPYGGDGEIYLFDWSRWESGRRLIGLESVSSAGAAENDT